MSKGFCSFIDSASELAETLKSKLVEMDGPQMTWNGMAGVPVRLPFVHINVGPGPEWPLLCYWYCHVWFSWKAQLLQPHQPDLSQIPNAASTIQSNVSNDFLCIRFDHRLSHVYACIAKLSILPSFVQNILTHEAIFLRWLHVDSQWGKVLGVHKIKIIK